MRISLVLCLLGLPMLACCPPPDQANEPPIIIDDWLLLNQPLLWVVEPAPGAVYHPGEEIRLVVMIERGTGPFRHRITWPDGAVEDLPASLERNWGLAHTLAPGTNLGPQVVRWFLHDQATGLTAQAEREVIIEP